MGCDLSSKCCKTWNRTQMPQVTAQHPPAEVHPASKSPSGSCNDGDDGTCCPGTGDRVSACRSLQTVTAWFSKRAPLGAQVGSASPSIPSSLLPLLALEGLPRRREEEGADGQGVCQRTLNLSLPFIAATQTLVSFSPSTQWLNTAGKSQWLC